MDYCLPVVRPETFSIDGLEIFTHQLETIRANLRAGVTAPALVLNGLNRSFVLHKAYGKALAETGYKIYNTGQTLKLAEAETNHLFLAELDPNNKTLAEYNRLAQGVI